MTATAPSPAMRRALAQTEANARQILADCKVIRAAWANPDAPVGDGFMPERMGYVDEVRAGDRVMIDQRWREVRDVQVGHAGPHLCFGDGGCFDGDLARPSLRLQKRAGAPAGALGPDL